MISRRELLTAGMAGGLASNSEAAAASTTAQSQSEVEVLREIARNLQGVDRTVAQAWLSNSVTYGLVAKVRNSYESYFRANQKFPDFIEIGIAVFMDVYDWHIKNQQQLMVTRGPDGRYWIQFMFTSLIARAEHEPNYIGIPYDKA
jgi:hypothetical protein